MRKIKQSPKIKIFVAHTSGKSSEVVSNEIFCPVCGGAGLVDRVSEELMRDDTGENISSRNRTFNELTVMYWAWKNVEADYYGLCHYRRYMNFSGRLMEENIWGNVIEPELSTESIYELKLDDVQAIQQQVEPYDFLYTEWDVAQVGYHNLREQYADGPTQMESDLDVALDVLKSIHSEDMDYADRYLNGTKFYPCFMFVMKKELFQDFCAWLFPMLFELEKRLDISEYSEKELRVFGLLGERLYGIYLTRLLAVRPELKSRSRQCLFFQRTQKQEVLQPHFSTRNVAIEMCVRDRIIPYVSVALESLLENADSSWNYDVVLLHSDVKGKTMLQMQRAFSLYSNVHIRFFDMSEYIQGMKWSPVDHVPEQSAYRLFIPEIFAAYDRVLHLDADIIVCTDIVPLYRTELGDNMLAAVHDVDYCGHCKVDPNLYRYSRETLGLEDPFKQYLQAGIVLFNVSALRAAFDDGVLVQDCLKKKYMYFDQDTLNANCVGHVKFIDFGWNVMTDCGGKRISLISEGPATYYHKYLEARKSPKIIHYAGYEKPWETPLCDFGDVFWRQARRSPYYEQCLKLLAASTKNEVSETAQNHDDSHLANTAWARFVFPWRLVKPGSRVVLRGGGIVGQAFLHQLKMSQYAKAVAICDRASRPSNEIDVPWIQPKDLQDVSYDSIVLAIENPAIAEDMRKELLSLGIPQERIVYAAPGRVRG